MSAPVCYVERTGSGTLIRSIRLVGERMEFVWTPPAPRGDEGTDPAAAVEQTRAAARWVAGQLPVKGAKALSGICVDVDGGLCLWLSAPSADAAVVAAAMVQGRSPEDGTGAEAGGGGGGLLALASAGVGMERSIQALAGGEGGQGEGGGGGKRQLALLGPKQPTGERRRMAVLSVPDLTVRVFLDELDALGVEFGPVATFWHAIAAAWDPDRPVATSGFRAMEERVASSQRSCSAVVVLDPGTAETGEGGGEGSGGGGRLVWSWSIGGELAAGGTMRLRTVVAPAAAPEVDGVDGGARRIAAEAARERAVVCGAPEAGRLIADWLSWSAQLGLSPGRIICVGPMPAGEGEGPGLVELLARGWKGASVDAAVHGDPVGATMERLAGRGGEGDADAADPRSALVELSHRPGRAHRQMYRWTAAALTLAAGAVAGLGWKVSGAAREAAGAAARMDSEARASLAAMDAIVPNISHAQSLGQAALLLQANLERLRQNRPRLNHEEPILAELGRLLEAMDSAEVSSEMRLEELHLNSLSGSARLLLPEDDALSGPRITAELQRIPGLIVWSGNSGAGGAGQAMRSWNLSGAWRPRGSRPQQDGRMAGGGG